MSKCVMCCNEFKPFKEGFKFICMYCYENPELSIDDIISKVRESVFKNIDDWLVKTATMQDTDRLRELSDMIRKELSQS